MLEQLIQYVTGLLKGIDPETVKQGAQKAADAALQAANAAGGTEAISNLWNNHSWIIIGVLVIFVLSKAISLPFKFLINGLIGCAMLLAVNFVGAYLHFAVPVNVITALIAGIFGIPGLVAIVIYYTFF